MSAKIMSTTIITPIIVDTSKNTPEPASSLKDDNIENASRNTLAMKIGDPPSKMPYAVGIAFNIWSDDVASLFRQPAYDVQISIGTQANALRLVACILDTSAAMNFLNKSFFP